MNIIITFIIIVGFESIKYPYITNNAHPITFQILRLFISFTKHDIKTTTIETYPYISTPFISLFYRFEDEEGILY